MELAFMLVGKEDCLCRPRRKGEEGKRERERGFLKRWKKERTVLKLLTNLISQSNIVSWASPWASTPI